MANFLTTSIGKKVIMSITGLFLILFLLVHLTLNLLTLVGEETYNTAAQFMQTNPIMKILEIVLALGFLFHIVYSIILTIQNMKARPIKFSQVKTEESVSWSSQNMLVLGILIGCFLTMHLYNYYLKIHGFISISEEISDYTLVTQSFKSGIFTLIYLVSFIFLYLHLNHAFQSAFQTLGLNNSLWMPRLKAIGTLYSLVISVGFSIIAIYFFIVQNI